ncbi:MAG TPA: MBL fold metallo-hydrolase [Solirubrobacteraceae bacterium]|jgi:glyoxylase-like metal-dependent hydrolase (beta-lactamase superfamily II)|nr:MBL fold metallo-hydrolase [Solirubrobacteraceae bacterium]
MKQLADGLYLLRGFPPNAINVYLAEDVLIDAATRQGESRIMHQIEDRTVKAHALTHAHPDHQGASHAICERLQIPLWCGEGDVDAMQTPGAISNSQAPGWLNGFQQRFWTGPPHPVARALKEGDGVAGFTVLEAPGHSRGHIAYWREADRVLILGDVLNGMNLLSGKRGLQEPPTVFTPDPVRNRASIRKLAALEPQLVCFGHGPPLRDPEALREFVARLPVDGD